MSETGKYQVHLHHTSTAARIPAGISASFHIISPANIMQPVGTERDLPKAALGICSSSIRNPVLIPSAYCDKKVMPPHSRTNPHGLHEELSRTQCTMSEGAQTFSSKIFLCERQGKEKETTDLLSSSMAGHGKTGKTHHFKKLGTW